MRFLFLYYYPRTYFFLFKIKMLKNVIQIDGSRHEPCILPDIRTRIEQTFSDYRIHRVSWLLLLDTNNNETVLFHINTVVFVDINYIGWWYFNEP